ncbi:MAG: hypothetical protein IJI19_01445, partial [Ruminococcus sp.]|nr:hypothetical protein [Ruminococcus sp.]
ENNYYAHKPAASVKSIGSGRVYYFGAAFAEDTAKAFIDLIDIKSPVTWDIPENIELAIRGNYAFLLNFDSEPVSFACDILRDELTGREFDGIVEVSGHDAVAVKVNIRREFDTHSDP